MAKFELGVKRSTKEKFTLLDKTLKKHLIALGSSGSGKTVFCKALIEEAFLSGIPSILIDPQGDLASLGISATEKFKPKVVVYTPTSSKGIPICLNPLKLPPRKVEYEDLVSILHPLADSLVKLLGYNLKHDTGKAASTLLFLIFMDSWKKGKKIETFDRLAEVVENPPAIVKNQIKDFIKNDKELKVLSKKIKFLTIGARDLLFQFGVPVNIDLMLKKNQINVIYLNTLESQDDKHFFLFSLATELYNWMLSNPSPNLQALFMIDEIAEYIPAGSRKPITKDILRIIFKQARKYGIGCVISTQNPGDIDYKAFAQFGTWTIGRLTTKQDTEKVKNALKSIAGSKITKVISELPKLKPGEFLVFCPDELKDIEAIKVRWLYTKHATLTEKAVKQLMDPVRGEFSEFIVKKKKLDLDEIDEKIEMEESVQLEGVKKLFTLVKPCVEEDEIMDFVAKKKKKQFFFFGKHTETLSSLRMVLHPVYLTTVQVSKKGLLGSKTEEFTLVFDAEKGRLLKFMNKDLRSRPNYDKLINLKPLPLTVFKALMRERHITAEELAMKLKFTASSVKSNLKKLMECKIAGASKEDRRAFWKPLIRVNTNVDALHSPDMEIVEAELTGEIEKEKIKPKVFGNFVENFFENAKVMNMRRVYYPVYEVKLSNDSGTRVLFVSAVSGEEL
jgi:hypothetical protein